MNTTTASAPNKTSQHVANAREIYSIAQWSDGFFDINENGNLVAYPTKDNGQGIELTDIVDRLSEHNLRLPVLVRFTDILKRRLMTLRTAFSHAIKEYAYKGQYTGVYPIKVNQQRFVVEKIVEHGGEFVGLEAGSKPELIAVLAESKPDSVIVCNGYKDREYIRLALIGQKLGKKVFIILEKKSELALVIQEAKKLNVTPLLGVRVRLATMGAGRWQHSGGEKSKFGFSAAELLDVINQLKKLRAQDCLKLLHFHLGSQIANIVDIQRGLKECARFYVELHHMGFNIDTVDVGGGLSVDYEGTHSRNFCSMNYTIQEYANNIVYTLLETCDQANMPHPNIITESGRALTAHHAVLITNVIESESIPQQKNKLKPLNKTDHAILNNLWHGLTNVTSRSALEVYHDACYWMNEAHIMFTHGILTLTDRSRVEELYYETCHKVRQLLKPHIRSHRQVLDEINEKLADKHFCNFSLFQSLPDAWAIDHIFPILPITGLNKPLTRRGILQDITCDSDGKVEKYVDNQGLETTLPLFNRNKQGYLLGIFLVGAYQEILGDMHNLFGDTDSVHVEMTTDGEFNLYEPSQGDTVMQVLEYVHYDRHQLLESYKTQIKNAKLTPAERKQFLHELDEGIHGYTYLEE